MEVPLTERVRWFVRTYLRLAVNKFRRDGIGPTFDSTIIVLRRLYKRHVIGPFLGQFARLRLLQRDELREQARTQDLYWELSNDDGYDPDTAPEACLAPNPFHDEDVPQHIQQTASKPFNFETPFVTELSDAVLVGPSPSGFTDDGVFILDTIGSLSHNFRLEREMTFLFEEHGFFSTIGVLLTGVDEVDATLDLGCLLMANDKNYGHWLSEHVHKLRAVERYEEATGRRPTLILEEDPPTWKREYLEIFGYDESDWIEWDVETMRVERLVLPSFPNYTVPGCEWLRERVLVEAADVDDQEFSSRVFISRRKAAKKRIKNRDEVLDVLERFGFEKYVLEDMSVREQAALFANAEYVVAPTGSGLHNVVYGEDLSILELVPHKRGNEWYRLSQLLGFKHEHLFGSPAADNPMGRNHFTVSPEKLEPRVAAMVEDR
jgi:hypothetical protein